MASIKPMKIIASRMVREPIFIDIASRRAEIGTTMLSTAFRPRNGASDSGRQVPEKSCQLIELGDSVPSRQLVPE